MSSKQSAQDKGKHEENKKRSPLVMTISILLLPVNLFIGFAVLKSGRYILPVVLPFIKHSVSIDTFEGKMSFLVQVLFYFAVFYACVITSTIFFRVTLMKPDPVSQRDPPVIIACQRILTNSLEQFAIFIANLAYFVIFSSKESDKNLVLSWAVLFMLSRVLFTVGYVFGTLVNFTLFRQTGFVIGFCLNCFLTVHNLGLMDCVSFIS
ncbi:hypothetical protein ABPG72_008127 [Tetrahymena utriculariae]